MFFIVVGICVGVIGYGGLDGGDICIEWFGGNFWFGVFYFFWFVDNFVGGVFFVGGGGVIGRVVLVFILVGW